MPMARNETKKDIAKGTLRKEIRSYIQEQIASGRFKAGDRIVETQLAKELNVESFRFSFSSSVSV